MDESETIKTYCSECMKECDIIGSNPYLVGAFKTVLLTTGNKYGLSSCCGALVRYMSVKERILIELEKNEM